MHQIVKKLHSASTGSSGIFVMQVQEFIYKTYFKSKELYREKEPKFKQ